MILKELLSILKEEGEKEWVQDALALARQEVPHDARPKDIEIFYDRKTIEWVTQDTNGDADRAEQVAKVIAAIFKKDGLYDWTIKVVVRYEWDNDNGDTPWQIAKS